MSLLLTRTRRRAGHVARLGTLVLTVLAACTDPVGPRNGDRLTTSALRVVDVPPDTVLALRELAVSIVLDSAVLGRGLRELALVVDAGTPGERTQRLRARSTTLRVGSPMTFSAAVPGAGRHRITVRFTDDAGTVEEASFSREFRVPELAAGLRVLAAPDDSPTDAAAITDAGEVAGWRSLADSTVRPLVWRDGVARELPLPDGSVGARALRLNARGDVAGEASFVRSRDMPAVWPAEGGARIQALAPSPATVWGAMVDLTEQRQLLFGYLAYDVVTGAARKLVDPPVGMISLGALHSMNDAGQAVGLVRTGLYNFENVLVGAAPSEPAQNRADTWDQQYGRYGFGPRSIDAEGRVLRREDFGYSILSLPAGTGGHGGAAEGLWLDEPFGNGAQVVLARRGGVLAAFQPADSSVYLWRVADRTPRRLVFPSGSWAVDGVRAVNAAGVVVVHGRDRSTGRGAALVLTPGAP